ncbi:ribonuclease H-like domain-containing protein [Rhizophagus irregularis DAOM 181602=DAOM 197198]|nr:ribonuclease H-like domain-containing protein [Rhizophagus irregularis DAOM 181602=DAOM 197198]
MSDNLTLTLDRWSSSNYRSIWNFTILTPNRKEYIFQFSDLFSDSHTGEYIAEKKMLSIELEYQNFQLLSVIMDLMFKKHVN